MADRTVRGAAPPGDLPAIEAPRVCRAVSRLLGHPVVSPGEWTAERIGGSLGAATRALSRLSGVARTARGAETRWSLVVKVVRPPTHPRYAALARDPRHWAYWQREPLAYESGVLADLPGRFAAPRLVLAERPAAEEIWLWLEDVPDHDGPVWPEARYSVAARHLGELGGAYLAPRSLPEFPWLAEEFFRKRIALAEQEHGLAVFWRDETWRHPLVAGRFPADTPARVRRIWDARRGLLATLDGAPRTLRHGDAHRQNLRARRLADGTEQTVALDWAALGHGPLGADLTDLAIGALVGPRGYASAELPAALFAAYADGLEAAGQGRAIGTARRGFAITMALAGITRLHWTLATALDEHRRPALADGGRSPAGTVDAWATATTAFLALGEEALAHG